MKNFKILILLILNFAIFSNFSMDCKLNLQASNQALEKTANHAILEKIFEFKELPTELRQYIINMYLLREFVQERDIGNLIKRILESRAKFKEVNNVVTQKSFWNNIFENFFYNLLHFKTTVAEVNTQIAKSERLIYKCYKQLKKSHFIDGKTCNESQFYLNLIVPSLAAIIHRINITRMFKDFKDKEQFSRILKIKKLIEFDYFCIGSDRMPQRDNNLNKYMRDHDDLQIKEFIDSIKEKTNKLWHPDFILELSEVHISEASLKTLIEAGANLDVQDSFGSTPLMRAGRRFFIKHVQMLLDAGVNSQTVNKYGETALDVALTSWIDSNQEVDGQMLEEYRTIVNMLKEAGVKK